MRSPFSPQGLLLATLLYIVAVASFHRYAVAELVVYGAYPLYLGTLAQASLGVVVRRTLLASPFVLTAAAFNPLLDSGIVAYGGLSFGAGWLSLASVALRYVLTMTATLALIELVSIQGLAGGMCRLGLPEALPRQVVALSRYQQHLREEFSRMLLAYRLRSGRHWPRLAESGAFLGGAMLRAVGRGESIQQAMLLRGGSEPPLPEEPWNAADSWLVMAVVGGCALFRLFPPLSTV